MPGDDRSVPVRGRAVLALTSCVHFLHDGFSDIIPVLLPVWAAEFRLSFAQVGFLRTAYTGGMALFQIPAGLLSERLGERKLLAAGTAVTAAGLVAAGAAGGFASLALLLLLAGLGSGVQHPLSSALVSKAYETGPRRAALGTYNFSGDLGKMALPALLALSVGVLGWRASLGGAAFLGLAAALAIVPMLAWLGAGGAPADGGESASSGDRARGWGIRDRRGFQALAAIGMIDSGTRSPFLTLLPFVLIDKGATMAGVGGALTLLFAGGATGKFVCGLLAERAGVIRTVVFTEAATAAGILAVVAAPLPVALAVLLPLGIALNGTSSVLYASVAEMVAPERRTRAYGLYYTLGIGSSALTPSIYGVVSDLIGVPAAMTVVGILVLVTIPLCLRLRAHATAGRPA